MTIYRYKPRQRREIVKKYIPVKDVQEGQFVAFPRFNCDSAILKQFRKHYEQNLYIGPGDTVIVTPKLVERRLVAGNSTKTIEYYHNKLETCMYNSSEGVGGTYQTLQRQGFVDLCERLGDMLRSNGGPEINSTATFMDIGAGQGRLCWYAASILGCRSIGIEICPHRAKIAAHTALSILRNEDGRFPTANNRVAYHCLDAEKASDWSEVQIFFLWDTAFPTKCVMNIYPNIVRAMKPDENKIIVHGTRRRVERVEVLKALVEVVEEKTMACPFKSFGSSNTFVLMLVRKKVDSHYPQAETVLPSIVSMSQPFFRSVASAIDQYERLEKETGVTIAAALTTRKFRRKCSVSGSTAMDTAPDTTIVPQVPPPLESCPMSDAPVQLTPLRLTLANQNQGMDPYREGSIFPFLEFNNRKHRGSCTKRIYGASCPQVLGGVQYFTELSAFRRVHPEDDHYNILRFHLLPLPAVMFGWHLITVFKTSIGAFRPCRVMSQQDLVVLKRLISELWYFAILRLPCFKDTGRYAGASHFVCWGVVEYMHHLDSFPNTLSLHEQFLSEIQDSFCWDD